MPPRTATSPGDSIASTRRYPPSTSHATSSVVSTRVPARSSRTSCESFDASGTACISAAIGATMTPREIPSASRRTTANRATVRSALGLDSPGRISIAGNSSASAPSARISSTASSASSRCATTSTTVPCALATRASSAAAVARIEGMLPAEPCTAIVVAAANAPSITRERNGSSACATSLRPPA